MPSASRANERSLVYPTVLLILLVSGRVAVLHFRVLFNCTLFRRSMYITHVLLQYCSHDT